MHRKYGSTAGWQSEPVFPRPITVIAHAYAKRVVAVDAPILATICVTSLFGLNSLLGALMLGGPRKRAPLIGFSKRRLAHLCVCHDGLAYCGSKIETAHMNLQLDGCRVGSTASSVAARMAARYKSLAILNRPLICPFSLSFLSVDGASSKCCQTGFSFI
jgi:hypothetical protein